MNTSADRVHNLHQHASDTLHVEIDKIEALLESLAAARRAKGAH